LPAEERVRARSFHFDQDRDAFATTRLVLRHLLAAYTGTAPEAVELKLGARKKPQLASGAVQFNVSHSAGMSLLAFAQDEVGVDVERIRAVPGMDEIMERNFAPGEQREWRELAETERERGFFLGWTRKEAYIKALGEGLYLPLASFDVSLAPDEPAIFRSLPEWSLYDFAIPGYAAALAIRGTGHAWRAWRLAPSLVRAIGEFDRHGLRTR
jgi:4'-phosphopantetheinyl transferase